MAEREYWQQGRRIIEQRYFINSIKAYAGIFARAVCGHWGVENRLHRYLDVTFREDESRTRKGNAPAIMTTIRPICLNLLQKHGLKLSIKKMRYRLALNDDFRAKILFG